MDKLDADISANVVKGTNMLTLSVTAHSPKDSIDIIKTVMDNYTPFLYRLILPFITNRSKTSGIELFLYFSFPPQNGEMAKKGFFLGMAVCILLFAIWSYMHNTVKQEREVEKKLDARSFHEPEACQRIIHQNCLLPVLDPFLYRLILPFITNRSNQMPCTVSVIGNESEKRK